ncbi:MAG: hypothetical protein WC637_14695 [Victivallales bacterium]
MKKCLALIFAIISIYSSSQEIRFSGVIGQSQPSDADPCPALSFQGVALDGANRIWAAPGGNRLIVFVKAADGSWRVDGMPQLPAGTAGRTAVWFNGKNIVAWLGDNRVAIIDTEERKVTATFKLPDKTSSVFMPSSRGAGAGRFDLLALSGCVVYGIGFDGVAAEKLLTMPDLREVPYTSIGIDPISGDILAGTPYPLQKIFRFSADGTQVGKDGWPRGGWPVQFFSEQGEACFVNQSGVITRLPASSLSKSKASAAVQFEFAQSVQGIAYSPDGSCWLASSQGLLNVGTDGICITRLGGISDIRCLAVSSSGEVIAMTEKGQRAVRFLIDGRPCSAPMSRGNEPWRVGANWKDRAVSIAPDIAGYFVLDDDEMCIWRFDPARTVWGDTPWMSLKTSASFTKPTAIAVGELFVWVIDNGSLFESDSRDLSFKKANAAFPEGFTPFFAAACNDNLVFLASEKKIIAMERAGDGAFKVRWSSPALFRKIAAIAAGESCVVVADADAGELVSMSAADGAVLAKSAAPDIPGKRFSPTALAFRAPWLVVADQAGKRLIRFRIK